MPKPKILNVRVHLDHVQLVIDAYKKYGQCPAVDTEIARLSLYNKAIIRKHDAQKLAGNRKDIRMPSKKE